MNRPFLTAQRAMTRILAADGWWVGAILGGAFLLPLVYSCTEDSRLPSASPFSTLRADGQSANPFGPPFQVPVPEFNDQGIAPVMTGIVIPPGVEAKVTVTGFLTYTVNGAVTVACPPPLPAPFSPGGLTTVGPAGFLPVNDPRFNGGYRGGEVDVYESTDNQPPPNGIKLQFQPQDASAGTVTATVQGFPPLGRLWVVRPPSFPSSCGVNSGTPQGASISGFFVSGSQTLSADFARRTCHVAVTPQRQADSQWGGIPYDSSGQSIGSLGCALTALSMQLNTAGHPTNPGSLDSFMIRNSYSPGSSGDFIGPNVNFTATVRDFTNDLKFNQIRTSDPDSLGSLVCQKLAPVTVGVKLQLDPKTNQLRPHHFVVATGVENGAVTITDPGDQTKTRLSDYQNQFVTRGYVGDPPGAIGELAVAVDNQHLLVADESGRRTGFDPASGATLEDIPQSAYAEDGLEGLPTFAAFATIFQPGEGSYQVTVVGENPGTYTLSIRGFARDGSRQTPITRPGFTDGTTTDAFNVQYSAAAGVAPVVTRIVTFTSALKDIRIGLKLGLIDDQGIANALTQKMEAARAAAARGAAQASANILNALQSLVQAQRTKHIQEIAAQVLLDDVARLSIGP